MMKRKYFLSTSFQFSFLFSLVALSIFMVACDSESSNEVQEFDRGALLESLATNLIIPNFETLQSSVNELSAATDAFVENTTEANLQSLRSEWVQTVMDYQHCSAFGFGPGELLLGAFPTVVGVFPVDLEELEASILDESFSLDRTFSRDIRGFYGVEYLIYGSGETDAELVANFSPERKAYLSLLVGELKTTFDGILDEWNTIYLESFTTETGTFAGSPISLLYNEFVRDFENLKNFKVGIPGGFIIEQGQITEVTVEPTRVEAYYSGISTDLIREHFQSSKNIWAGLSRNGTDIIGFKEYLSEIENGEALITQTEEEIARIEAAFAALPDGRLSDVVETDEISTLFARLQANVSNFKSSMSSLLGISITFNSGDGD